MKRTASWWAAVVVAAGLTGCATQSAATTETKPEPTPAVEPAKTDEAKPAEGTVAAAEQPKAEEAKTEPAKTETPPADATKTDTAKADAAKTDTAKADAAKTDTAKTDTAKTDTAKTDTAKTDTAKTDAAKTDTAKTGTKTDTKTDTAKTESKPPKGGVYTLVPIAAPDKKIERQWKSKCSSCHGAGGKADTEKGRSMKMEDFTLASWQTAHGNDELKKTISDGLKRTHGGVKQEMDGFAGELTPEQIDALVQYVRWLGAPK